MRTILHIPINPHIFPGLFVSSLLKRVSFEGRADIVILYSPADPFVVFIPRCLYSDARIRAYKDYELIVEFSISFANRAIDRKRRRE